jgi:hypothetical protein
MRTIKFRGKRKDGKGWAYGDLLTHPSIGCTIHQHYEDLYQHDGVYLGTEVIPETVGQFTGLLDDYGNEIYTGDKIEDINQITWIVEWNDDTCKFQLSDGSDINDGERYGTSKTIVGNIFDNQNLLSND